MNTGRYVYYGTLYGTYVQIALYLPNSRCDKLFDSVFHEDLFRDLCALIRQHTLNLKKEDSERAISQKKNKLGYKNPIVLRISAVAWKLAATGEIIAFVKRRVLWIN